MVSIENELVEFRLSIKVIREQCKNNKTLKKYMLFI